MKDKICENCKHYTKQYSYNCKGTLRPSGFGMCLHTDNWEYPPRSDKNTCPFFTALDDENSEIEKIGREIAEMSDEEFEANCKKVESIFKRSTSNERGKELDARENTLPIQRVNYLLPDNKCDYTGNFCKGDSYNENSPICLKCEGNCS